MQSPGMGSVTVKASRIISEKSVGKTSIGIPIVDISLSYGVSAKDLDLASHAGAMELEKRVNDAALEACKELNPPVSGIKAERSGMRQECGGQCHG